jgi:hypothetical protein
MKGWHSHSGRKLVITAQSQVGVAYKKGRKEKERKGERGNRERDDMRDG